jgi:serine/threonine-protein kinase
MAPERVMGQGVDSAADVYGVAVMTFEMLTGARPFVGGNPVEVMTKHVRSPRPALDGVPAAAQQVVHLGLAKEPAQRLDARAFARELARALVGA